MLRCSHHSTIMGSMSAYVTGLPLMSLPSVKSPFTAAALRAPVKIHELYLLGGGGGGWWRMIQATMPHIQFRCRSDEQGSVLAGSHVRARPRLTSGTVGVVSNPWLVCSTFTFVRPPAWTAPDLRAFECNDVIRRAHVSREPEPQATLCRADSR